MFIRKLKKLKRDPKLFFNDMYLKNINKIKNKFRSNTYYEGNYQYTIVSAAYNVGSYLDDYFKSIVNQSLHFEKHIKIIIVDDGSIDNTKEITEKWRGKYPNNISYYYKENGGQASARNLGLQYVDSEWVTFTDPDDILDRNYFYEVDLFLKKNENHNIDLVSCSLIFYFEKMKIYKDTHPLKYRYSNGNIIQPLDKMNKNLQLSAATAFFKTSIIISSNTLFSTEIKPNFEDAHFVGKYLSFIGNNQVAFIRSAKYYYRKRADGTSTLDTSWQNPSLFDEVLSYGCLDLLQHYQKRNLGIPLFIQRKVLYHLIWYIKYLINNAEKVSFLSDEQKKKFKSLLMEIFSMIEVKTIMDFELAGCWFYHRVVMLAYFKKTNPDFQIVYVDTFDFKKNLVQIFYYTKEVNFESIKINNSVILPHYAKIVRHDFLGDDIILERRIWLPIPQNGILKIDINNTPTRISLGGKQYSHGVKVEIISKVFFDKKPKYKGSVKYENAWLLMDRDIQADDNAEHLYCYIRKYHPEQKIFFVLRQESHDWSRLANKGFDLLAFGSKQHELALQSCRKLISSHIDRYITNYLGNNMLAGRHFIFLQHGVTMNDISNWLNSKEEINLFITTTNAEYRSIVGNNTRYKFTEKDVVLTGFPRHDKLFLSDGKTQKVILIMPTWRKNIVGTAISMSNQREINPDFINTKYGQYWYSFLHSRTLENLSKEYGYKIIFFPHANIIPYLNAFNTPKYIEIIKHEQGSIQEVFQKTSIMITDYTSAAFDVALQNKPIIYYQFDEDEVFAGSHIFAKGYYDYRLGGFGPVVKDEGQLFIELEKILANDGKPEETYQQRINETFRLRDGKNCERVYQAIIDLDKPQHPEFINTRVVKEYAEQATIYQKWLLAEQRWQLLYDRVDDIQKRIECVLPLVQALRKQGKLSEAQVLFDTYYPIELNQEWARDVIQESACMAMAKHDWVLARELWERELPRDCIFNTLLYVQCLAELNQIASIDDILNWQGIEDNEILLQLIKAWRCFAVADWDEAIELLNQVLEIIEPEYLSQFKPQLLLAECLFRKEEFLAMNTQLGAYEKHTQNDPLCREKIAKLAFERKDWNKVIAQLDKAYPLCSDIPEPFAAIYIHSLLELKKYAELESVIPMFPESYLNKSSMSIKVAKIQWSVAEEYWRLLYENTNIYQRIQFVLPLVQALRKQGKLSDAQTLFDTHYSIELNHAWTRDVIQESACMAMAKHDWVLARELWERELPRDCIFNTLLYVQCLAELNQIASIDDTLNWQGIEDNEILLQLIKAWRCFAVADWDEAIELLNQILEIIEPEYLSQFKPQLLLAECLFRKEEFLAINTQLGAYEKHTQNDPLCREKIAKLAFERKDWNKVIAQLDKAYPLCSDIPEPFAAIYIHSLLELKKYSELELTLSLFPQEYLGSISIIDERIKFLFKTISDWNDLILEIRKFIFVKNLDISLLILPHITSLREQGRLSNALTLFKECFELYDQANYIPLILREKAHLDMAYHLWEDAISSWEYIKDELQPIDMISYIQCLAESKKYIELERFISLKSVQSLDLASRQLALTWVSVAYEDWNAASSMIHSSITNFNSSELRYFKPQILLARCLREQGFFDQAEKHLAVYEKHTPNNHLCCEQTILISLAREEWDTLHITIRKTYKQLSDIPEFLSYIYVKSLRLNKEFSQAEVALREFLVSYSKNIQLKLEEAELASDCHLWGKAVELWTNLQKVSTLANIRIRQAYKYIGEPNKLQGRKIRG